MEPFLKSPPIKASGIPKEFSGTEILAREAAFKSHAPITELRELLDNLSQNSPIDHCILEEKTRSKKLLLSDMDSTIIAEECLDELADFAGKGAEISAITERAMAGELDFEAALKERVAMLKGLNKSALSACYNQRIHLNEGAKAMIGGLKSSYIRTVLVSGGFSYFTNRVAKACDFDADFANELGIENGKLTGEVIPPILGREAKKLRLESESKTLSIGLDETIAIGDGANDLAMIEAAGLGIAYKAKPIVKAKADAAIEHTTLESLNYFLGLADAG